jgi:hypothetical protein
MKLVSWFSLPLLLLLAFGSPQRAFSNSPRSPQIAELAHKVRAGDKRAVQLFWIRLRREGAPLIETIDTVKDHYLVTFLWRAESPVRNVLLISGLSNESYSRTVLSENLLTRLPGTDV